MSEAIDCDDARDMIADGNAVVRRAVRARRCVCAGRGLCVHTWPVVHDVLWRERYCQPLSTLPLNSFFQKTKQNTLFMQKSRTQSADIVVRQRQRDMGYGKGRPEFSP